MWLCICTRTLTQVHRGIRACVQGLCRFSSTRESPRVHSSAADPRSASPPTTPLAKKVADLAQRRMQHMQPPPGDGAGPVSKALDLAVPLQGRAQDRVKQFLALKGILADLAVPLQGRAKAVLLRGRVAHPCWAGDLQGIARP